MKKLAAILVLFAITATSYAQQHRLKEQNTPHKKDQPKQELKYERMEKELNLTPEQKERMKAIDAKYAPIEEKQKAERERLRAEMKETRQKKQAEMQEVLTPEQRKIVEEKKQERKEKMKDERKDNPNRGEGKQRQQPNK
jgi:periplasmic protein CpxP/Spy